MNSECVFCKIVRGEIPSKKVFENEVALGILDINPVAEGHCIIISKKHKESFYELEDEELSQLFIAVKAVAQKIKRVFEQDYICIFSRGQRIPHVHVQVFPSKHNDQLHGFPQVIFGKAEVDLDLVAKKLSES